MTESSFLGELSL